MSTGYTPRPWQAAVHDALSRVRFGVLVVHRRGGKTVLAVNSLVDAALRFKGGDGRFAYLAPFLKQARDVAWGLLRDYTKEIPSVEYHESTLEVRLPTGSRIRLYGSDNADAIRGVYLDGVVLDEVADMRPNVWGEIIRPTLADRKGWAIFIGTPKGINLFSELYHAAINDPDWHTSLLTWRDTGALDPEEIELARHAMTDAQFRQEFECDFQAAAENALIPLDLARSCAGKNLRSQDYDWAPRVLGVDVARYGDGRTVIFPRQGLAAFHPIVLRGADTMETASAIAGKVAEWRPQAVFVDSGGVGGGVVDRLRQLQVPVLAVDFGSKASKPQFANKRVEIWCAMRDWLKAGAAIPDDPALVADLCGPRFDFANAAGKMALESKDEMRARGLASPDLGDALAVTHAYPLAPLVLGPSDAARLRQSTQLVTDWDPMREFRNG